MLIKHAGVSRFAYNWGLERKIEVHRMNQLPVPQIKNPTSIDLHKELNKLKRIKYSWMYEVSKCVPQEALRDLDKAFKSFFECQKNYPKFKSKKHGLISFRFSTGSIVVSDGTIQLPRLGVIRLKEKNYLPKDKHILSATVSESIGKWFVSLQVEEDIVVSKNNGQMVGVDLGVSSLATVSNGIVFDNPKTFRLQERKLKRLQRSISRKKKGSKNRIKCVRKLQRIHALISNIRKDTINKATSWLAKTKSVIVIEDLNVSGMLKNHNLAGAISDAGMGEARRQLEYKTKWYGSKLIVANQFYPSSKMCSVCGTVKEELSLSERVFKCEVCHSEIDRDLNASINLEKLAISSMESENACLRQEVTGSLITDNQCLPMMQESNAIGNGGSNG